LLPLGSSTNSPVLGLLTSPTSSPYMLVLTGQSNGAADLSISIPRGDGTVVRGTAANVTVVQGQQMRVVADLSNPNNLALQVDSSGNGSFATSIPLTMQGDLSRGSKSDFGDSDRTGDGQPGGQVRPEPGGVVRPDRGLHELCRRDELFDSEQHNNFREPPAFRPLGIRQSRTTRGSLRTADVCSEWDCGPARNHGTDSLREYAIEVAGPGRRSYGTRAWCGWKCLADGDRELLEYRFAARLQRLRRRWLRNVPVRSDGIYQYRYVHQDQCGGPFQMSTKDPQTGAVRSVSAYVRAPGQQMVIDLALLGLGSVAGRVSDLSGNPVPSAQVVAISGTDPQIGGRAFTDGVGNYTIGGITVGPVTVTAVKGISLGTSAGNIERAGTTAVVNVTMNGGAVASFWDGDTAAKRDEHARAGIARGLLRGGNGRIKNASWSRDYSSRWQFHYYRNADRIF